MPLPPASLLPAIGQVLLNRAALRLNLRPPRDGWRRAAGLVLRSEESTFILSAFGLSPCADLSPALLDSPAAIHQHIAARLHAFLLTQRDLHAHVLHAHDEDLAAPAPGPTYTLRFGDAPAGPARFLTPADWSGPRIDDLPCTHPHSLPLLNVVVRTLPDASADIWFRVNHVAADGVPAQEALTRLESLWPAHAPVRFPSPAEFFPFSAPRPIPGRPGCAIAQTFIDFAPLLAWRKQQNAILPEPMTVSAAILWQLSRHPHFRPLHIGTTVEVAPLPPLARGVGVVVARPSPLHAAPGGLARYVRTFNADMERTRRRLTDGCKTLDAAAYLPPRRARALLHHALDAGASAFGSIGLTMLKDAKVFGAPLAGRGHDNGFIAIGSLALPTAFGSPVGCVTVKGPADRIANYPRILAEALAITA